MLPVYFSLTRTLSLSLSLTLSLALSLATLHAARMKGREPARRARGGALQGRRLGPSGTIRPRTGAPAGRLLPP